MSQATVGALCAFSEDPLEYSSRPILISPSCKREDAKQHEELLKPLLAACISESETIRGSIWCISSDGESKRGKALASLCLKNTLSPSSAIYPQLSRLSALNLACGDREITADKDPKHIVKRLRGLLIRAKGVLINGTTITPAVLKRHLRDCGIEEKTINSLLNPSDRQDVVLASRLILAVSNLPEQADGADPVYAQSRHALCILGSIFGSYLEVFTNVTLTLQSQLRKLSFVGWMLYSLYASSRERFMPTLLYGDIQTNIKNAYFCVAKTKIATPSGLFWLIQLGTDQLEKQFGDLRTMIGSDANLDALQLSNRLNSAAECANILQQHPEWNRAPRRLHLPAYPSSHTNLSSKIDHLNPKSWIGDVSVQDVSLQTAWSCGRSDAEDALPCAVDDFRRLCDDSLRDLLRPFQTIATCEDAELSADDTEDAIADTGGSEHLSSFSTHDPEFCLDFEDIVASSVGDSSQPEPNQLKQSKMYLQINDKNIHKAALLRHCMGPDYAPGSTDRLKRVAALHKYNSSAVGCETDHYQDAEERLLADDPAAAVLLVDNKLFLAIIKILSFKVDGRNTHLISLDAFQKPNVLVRFHVLKLVAQNFENDSDADWIWTGRYEMFGGINPRELELPSCLVININPAVQVRNSSPDDVTCRAPLPATTYTFKTSELRALSVLLLEQSQGVEAQISSVASSDTFPYRVQGQ